MKRKGKESNIFLGLLLTIANAGLKKLTSGEIIPEVKEYFRKLNYGAVMLSQVSIFMAES
jgi:hypothetical protein